MKDSKAPLERIEIQLNKCIHHLAFREGLTKEVGRETSSSSAFLLDISSQMFTLSDFLGGLAGLICRFEDLITISKWL